MDDKEWKYGHALDTFFYYFPTTSAVPSATTIWHICVWPGKQNKKSRPTRQDSRPMPLHTWHSSGEGLIFLKAPQKSLRLLCGVHKRVPHPPDRSDLVEAHSPWRKSHVNSSVAQPNIQASGSTRGTKWWNGNGWSSARSAAPGGTTRTSGKKKQQRICGARHPVENKSKYNLQPNQLPN